MAGFILHSWRADKINKVCKLRFVFYDVVVEMAKKLLLDMNDMNKRGSSLIWSQFLHPLQ